MFDYHDWALRVIEDAERENPTCTCGAPTVLVADTDLGVWLQCSSPRRSASPVTRFLDLLGGHLRRQILASPAAGSEAVDAVGAYVA